MFPPPLPCHACAVLCSTINSCCLWWLADKLADWRTTARKDSAQETPTVVDVSEVSMQADRRMLYIAIDSAHPPPISRHLMSIPRATAPISACPSYASSARRIQGAHNVHHCYHMRDIPPRLFANLVV